MAVIEKVSLSPDLSDLPRTAIDRVRREISAKFWQWYAEEKSRILLERKIAFWTLRIRVSDIRFIFVEIFGEQP